MEVQHNSLCSNTTADLQIMSGIYDKTYHPQECSSTSPPPSPPPPVSSTNCTGNLLAVGVFRHENMLVSHSCPPYPDGGARLCEEIQPGLFKLSDIIDESRYR